MLKIVTKQEKEELFKAMSFYDFNTFSNLEGEEIVIKLKRKLGNKRYCDLVYNGFEKSAKKEYARKENLLLKIIFSILSLFNDDIYAVRYEEEWLRSKSISRKLNSIFSEICIKEDVNVVQINNIDTALIFCQSILKGNTHAYLLLKNTKLFIAPTDHLDIFLAGYENGLSAIKDLLNKSSNSDYFLISKR